MEHDFWHARWRDNQIGFHREDINPALLKHLDSLQLADGDRVFVPLCGKSLDLAWLEKQGLRVLGVELSPIAAATFFEEQGLDASVSKMDGFESYRGGDIEILCGDFFVLDKETMKDVRGVYDRAAMIALPPEMRRPYAAKMTDLLAPGCRLLLVTMEYPQEQMGGPPFAVMEQEVRDLYGDHFGITVLESEDLLAKEPGFRERGLTRLVGKTYLLERK